MSVQVLRQTDLPKSAIAHSLVGEDYGGIPASVLFVDAAPGQGPSLHKHAYAELFFVLEGDATFDDGEVKRNVRAGEVVIVSPNQPHAFMNSGVGPLHQIDVHLSPRFVREWLNDA